MLDLGLPTTGASHENADFLMERCKEVYRIVDIGEAAELLATVEDVAFDIETTALDPKNGAVRLSQFSCGDFTIIVDHFIAGSFDKLIPHLRGKRLWVYNAKFETRWADFYMADADYDELLEICDVDFLAKSYLGGGPSSLATMAKRDLKLFLSKEEQLSDWSAPTLRQDQYDYAAFDAYVTWLLFEYWDAKLNDDQFNAALFVFNDAVRGTIECEQTGLELDSEYHEQTVALWHKKQRTFERYLRKHTGKDLIDNLGSDMQISEFLYGILDEAAISVWPTTGKRKHGQKASPQARGKKTLQLEGKYLRAQSRQFPYPFSRWMAGLAGLKYYNKYLSTYGDNLLNIASISGNITSRFNIAQAATGRYSSSTTNLQNIPRKVLVRKAFYTANPAKRLMCLADYKGVEIRVLAELTDDKQLREDVIYGDVHAASCAQIFGYEYEYVLEVLASDGEGRFANIYPIIKEQRSKAKGFTFQLLYGAGPGALSDVLKCSFDEAVAAIDAWADRYGPAYAYRNVIFNHMTLNEGFLPVHDGRTIRVFKDDQTIPVAANYGIQGAAASVMYRAVNRVHRRFYEADLPAWLAATVHDEVLSYADRPHEEEAMQAQIDGMTEGWLDIFPGTNTDNLVDYAIGETWAAKP